MPSTISPPVLQQCRRSASAAGNSAAYRPSTFILSALIIWTAISAISEMLILPTAVIFGIVTYAPTFHFATKAIVRRYAEVEGVQISNTRWASRRAWLLTVSWVLNVGAHVGLWWRYRRDMLPEILLIPVFPGSQAVPVMMCIALRYTIYSYTMEREQRLRVARDGEEAIFVETALPQANAPTSNVSAQQEDLEPAIETAASNSLPPPAISLYQPSIPLLLISISLSLCTLVLDFQDQSKHYTQIFAIMASIQTYIPTILLHGYIILQILRKDIADALPRSAVIAGLSFDLIPLWLGTRAFMEYMQHGRSGGVFVDPNRMVPGGGEVLLATYFAVRYTRSVFAERRRRIKLGLMEDDLAPPIDDLEIPSSATQPAAAEPLIESSTTLYHPSPNLLVLSIILSTSCLIIESQAEPSCGVPMSAIVYIPTIIVQLHLIYQHYRRANPSSNTTPIQKFHKSKERAMQLGLIWLLTQAFYVFIWPVSQHLERNVMNPWVRWPAVVVIVYIAACYYVGDRQMRDSVGSIRLPPDIEEGVAPTGEPSAIDSHP